MPDYSGIGGKNMAASIMTGLMNGWTKRHQLGQAQGREDQLLLEKKQREDALIAQEQTQHDSRYARELQDVIDAEGRGWP